MDQWSMSSVTGYLQVPNADSTLPSVPVYSVATTEVYPLAPTITLHTFALFQLMFAIITVAIISGSVAGKMKFTWFLAFVGLWHIFVYCPLAHWIFFYDGWLATYGVLDFAGGMVIHVSSGVSSYVLAYLLGGPTVSHKAHNKVLVLLGAALLWFGWFGFNAGSAVSAGYSAGLAFTNTQFGAAAAMFTWNILETAFDGEHGFGSGFPTAIGLATGAVVGLVGITPSAGFVAPMWALFIGFFTALSVFFVPRTLKRYFGVNDTLDCFAIHGCGGMVGAALTGLFANHTYGNALYGYGDKGASATPIRGSFYGSSVQLGIQCVGISVTIVYSAIVTALIFGLLFAISKYVFKVGMAIPAGMSPDVSQHGEKAYHAQTTTVARDTTGVTPSATIRTPVSIESSSVTV